MSAPALDRTLAALADPHRRRVVDLLRERPHRAGELARAARVSFPAMSRHLKTLRRSGLVEEDRDELDSRVRIYRLRESALVELEDWLEMLLAVHGGAPRRARRRRARARAPRDTPYTTRGTPRIRKRLYWRKEDAEAAGRGDPEWFEKELARASRELRAVGARQYRSRGHL